MTVANVNENTWMRLLYEMSALELAAKLTLLALLFTHIGAWSVRPAILVLAAYGLLAPGAWRSALLWLFLFA